VSWFYEEHGSRKGPVSEEDMRTLATTGMIEHSTLCWTEAFGAEWQPAGSCSFWPPQPAGVPPALPASRVSNRWAWLSIFGPFVSSMIVNALAWIGGMPDRQSGIIAVILSFAIIFTSMLTDRRALMAAGFRPGSPFWILIPPLYFWRRIRFVGRGMLLFFLSMLVFLFQFVPSFSESWDMVRHPGNVSSYVSRHYEL